VVREHQLVVDEAIRIVGIHTFIGHAQRGNWRHRQPPGVGRGDLRGMSALARHGRSFHYREAMAARTWARMRDADVGAGCGPGSAAAKLAARACTKAPAAAASPQGSPAASNAPMTPDSTSPDPAVAAHDCPAELRKTGPPGSGMTVHLRFRNQ